MNNIAVIILCNLLGGCGPYFDIPKEEIKGLDSCKEEVYGFCDTEERSYHEFYNCLEANVIRCKIKHKEADNE